MKNYIQAREWDIVESGFDPHLNKISESIFSLGNGLMGQRANFEETYTGETLQGNYVAGVYYPDKTRVGWWKNGYPEYFAKVLNAANWMGLELLLDGETVDLSLCKIISFERVLHMKEGYLSRTFKAELPSGKQIEVISKRFFSIANDEIAALHYQLTTLNFSGILSVKSFIDGDVRNQDANYEEKFWDETGRAQDESGSYLTLQTKKSNFEVITGVKTHLFRNKEEIQLTADTAVREKYLAERAFADVSPGDVIDIYKTATNLSSQNYTVLTLPAAAREVIQSAVAKGFSLLMQEHSAAWGNKWKESDIVIEGDVAAQQAIRFNIFQLNQTYTGKDARLNIGPKGFTGEKYGGSTYWDTEAYCIPFYLSTAAQEVSRNLLIYRYRHLEKAIENAVKLGFKNGAALYPMVTMNGEECHNEWEITFEEIHRNGAIAFAIFNYIRYTGDTGYLKEYGLEVLIGIARFWKQRVNWSEAKQQYVILGVTGPNEYENNINNNWYTNTIAAWCLKYTIEAVGIVKDGAPGHYQRIVSKTALQEQEFNDWNEIAANIYLPYDEERGVFLQQEGYLDKEQLLVRDLPSSDRPLNQKWSWDRILRSCFIKQADVLQGMYFFEDDYSSEVLHRNFGFYESRTVHESSLSPCVHSILAAKLKDVKKAYEFYLRTSRLDLDDYNNDTEDGLHITSMAGTWMSIVEGFAGMRVREDKLSFTPLLPEQWDSFSFSIGFRGIQLKVKIERHEMTIDSSGQKLLTIHIHHKPYEIPRGTTIITFVS